MCSHASHVRTKIKCCYSLRNILKYVRDAHLNDAKGLSNGEKKSITEPLFFFDFADSFLFRV